MRNTRQDTRLKRGGTKKVETDHIYNHDTSEEVQEGYVTMQGVKKTTMRKMTAQSDLWESRKELVIERRADSVEKPG